MLRRSWLPLCGGIVLVLSAVSLFASPLRTRTALNKNAGTLASVTQATHTFASPLGYRGGTSTNQISVDGAILGGSRAAQAGGGPIALAQQPPQTSRQTSGWSLQGIKEWWLDKATDAREWVAERAQRILKKGKGKSRHHEVLSFRGGPGKRSSHNSQSGTGDPPPITGSGTGSTTGNSSTGSGTGSNSITGGAPSSPASGSNSMASGSSTGSGTGSNSTTSGDPSSLASVGSSTTSSSSSGSGSGTSGGSSSGSGSGSAGDPPPSGGTRDPAYWPFAADSPWNYPIGSNAQYADFNVAGGRRPAAGTGMKLGMDANTSVTWVGQPADPVRTWRYSSTAVQMHISDNATPTGGERVMTFVDVGHLYAQDSYGSGRDANGNWGAGGALVNVLLKGAGHGFDSSDCLGPNQFPDPNWCLGQTRSAGVPLFAGTVRPGELTNGIRHALALIVGQQFLRRSPGHVWPAAADDGSDGYTGGPDCNYSLGQLVAIPLSVDVESLPLVLPQSRNIARALQRYGAYSVDVSPGLFDVVVDYQAISEWWSWLNDPNWAHDMYEVIGAQLRVVTNAFDPTSGGQPRNGVKLDGGDGTLSAPLAPPFDR